MAHLQRAYAHLDRPAAWVTSRGLSQLVPVQPKYWDISDGTTPVFLRLQPGPIPKRHLSPAARSISSEQMALVPSRGYGLGRDVEVIDGSPT